MRVKQIHDERSGNGNSFSNIYASLRPLHYNVFSFEISFCLEIVKTQSEDMTFLHDRPCTEFQISYFNSAAFHFHFNIVNAIIPFDILHCQYLFTL